MAFIRGELIGTAGFYCEHHKETRHKGHVWGVYVAPQARRKGIAQAMMRFLLERAKAIPGLEQIQLSVATTQGAAISLYIGLGFRSYGKRMEAFKEGVQCVDQELMALEL